MLFGLLLTLGVAVLSVALRSFQTSFAQKVGAIGILVSTFLAVYFVSDSWVLALAAALAAWPWCLALALWIFAFTLWTVFSG